MGIDNWAQRASGLWLREWGPWRFEPCEECCSSSGEASSSSSGQADVGCLAACTTSAKAQYRVHFTNIGNQNCAQCTQYNAAGGFVLDWAGILGGVCTWQATPPICGGALIRLFISYVVPNHVIQVNIFPGGAGFITYYEKAAGKMDCANFAAYNVPFDGDATTECAVDGTSTCTVTPILYHQ